MAKADPTVQVIHPGSLLCLNTSHHAAIGPEGLEIGPDKPVALPLSLAQALSRYGVVAVGDQVPDAATTPTAASKE